MKMHRMRHRTHGRAQIDQARSTEAIAAAAADSDSADGASAMRGQRKGYAVVAVIYLLGLCMGALDMGIVNPARTVIQNSLGVDDSLGVWILTIYTLAYAASIPIMGKLADRHGRKYIYLVCIALFGGGSVLCGVAHDIGSFELLIAARAVQAIGGGGIMPVATAEFGTAFPEEKRGMALGLVGMVYGLASIFGSSAGSLILDVFGQSQWQFIFYVNIPICLVILALGVFKLSNTKADEVPPIDIKGALVLTIMTLSLMYGLKNIDFFDLGTSITSTDVYPFLIAFVVLLPVFILVERRAKDPVMNLLYFVNPNILIALICSVISGIIMMGTIFFPQFAENSLLLKSGAGGYFIMILGVGSGFGAMLSGKLIDKHGVKPVLAIGLVGSLAGSLFMALVACSNPTLLNVCVMLALTGLGLGFTMGTPLNYMMLQNTTDEESNSALATLSLVRSIGTAVAPAIMVAFVAHAGLSMQDNIMAVLPDEVHVSPLPHAAELDARLDEMRADEDTAYMFDGIDIPKLASYEVISVQMDGDDSDFDVEVSDEMLQKLQDSDVTTIVATCGEMTTEMFDQVKPQLIEEATDGIGKGIAAMEDGLAEMDDAIAEMTDGMAEMNGSMSELRGSISDMDAAIAGVQSGIDEMDGKISEMDAGAAEIAEAIAGVQSGIDEMDGSIAEMEAGISAMEGKIAELQADRDEAVEAGDDARAEQLGSAIAAMQGELAGMQAARDEMTAAREEMAGKRDELQSTLNEMEVGSAGMQAARDEMVGQRSEMQSARSGMQTGYSEMEDGLGELQDARDELADTIAKLNEVRDAIPGKFDEAEENYLAEIEEVGPQIQEVYRSTLNGGFRGMALFVAACAVVGLLVLIPYRDKAAKKKGDVHRGRS